MFCLDLFFKWFTEQFIVTFRVLSQLLYFIEYRWVIPSKHLMQLECKSNLIYSLNKTINATAYNYVIIALQDFERICLWVFATWCSWNHWLVFPVQYLLELESKPLSGTGIGCLLFYKSRFKLAL